jgi:hypothetical protein
MADLTLGSSPDKLTLNLVSGDPVAFDLTLLSAGAPIPWPSPPVLEFANGSDDWVATLSLDETTASWNILEADVTAVMAAAGSGVRLSVDGVTWWAGVWVKRA